MNMMTFCIVIDHWYTKHSLSQQKDKASSYSSCIKIDGFCIGHEHMHHRWDILF
jgi:hypothetical protein